ncbi:hypothetical protein CAOG_04429 [Capsaspora owczarzaki ATCC 30864]|uniref:Uncharacterized protein n=1 Tax=Capsaspora owczarzaki (strain ATCC 30864) TaxID=595528 RepID=A0A0D2WQ38_CAPO3|nr:hypothetical protein CAOG_04429 [Capsaspora owczarzaki ATCC 30864]KJE93675.1 hypothetical protein CAOG_004429 [Capsaspora owczarzaki ATCC 30864]|eukprot:XP_004348257.1 hypothetical protein CAOG_04429 [Capsaspora owczarzaki ATCC 30864]
MHVQFRFTPGAPQVAQQQQQQPQAPAKSQDQHLADARRWLEKPLATLSLAETSATLETALHLVAQNHQTAQQLADRALERLPQLMESMQPSKALAAAQLALSKGVIVFLIADFQEDNRLPRAEIGERLVLAYEYLLQAIHTCLDVASSQDEWLLMLKDAYFGWLEPVNHFFALCPAEDLSLQTAIAASLFYNEFVVLCWHNPQIRFCGARGLLVKLKHAISSKSKPPVGRILDTAALVLRFILAFPVGAVGDILCDLICVLDDELKNLRLHSTRSSILSLVLQLVNPLRSGYCNLVARQGDAAPRPFQAPESDPSDEIATKIKIVLYYLQQLVFSAKTWSMNTSDALRCRASFVVKLNAFVDALPAYGRMSSFLRAVAASPGDNLRRQGISISPDDRQYTKFALQELPTARLANAYFESFPAPSRSVLFDNTGDWYLHDQKSREDQPVHLPWMNLFLRGLHDDQSDSDGVDPYTRC